MAAMTFSDADRAIEQRLEGNWITTPIDINPNVPFSTPAPGAAYIKLSIFQEGRQRMNIGTYRRVKKQFGSIIIRIYTGLDEGSRAGLQYGDSLAALFREAEFDGVKCRQPIVTPAGQFDGRWQTNMMVPFEWISDE